MKKEKGLKILDRPTITINKDDPTKYDISKYIIQVVDADESGGVRIYVKHVPAEIGVSIHLSD